MKESDKNIGLYETLFDTVRIKTRNKYSFYLKLRRAKMSCSFDRCVLKYLTFEKWLIITRMFPYSISQGNLLRITLRFVKNLRGWY